MYSQEIKKTFLTLIIQSPTVRVLVTQSCLTLCDPMDCSPPGSSVHGISQQEYWSGLPTKYASSKWGLQKIQLSFIIWTLSKFLLTKVNNQKYLDSMGHA